MLTDWRALTPAQVLDSYPALHLGQVAYVLGHMKRSGEPNRRIVVDLIKQGRLVLIDSTQANTRWTVSANDVRAYLSGKPNLQLADNVKARAS